MKSNKGNTITKRQKKNKYIMWNSSIFGEPSEGVLSLVQSCLSHSANVWVVDKPG